MNQNQIDPLPSTSLIPVVMQPKGLAYFFQSWSGRLILINSILFLVTCLQANSVEFFSTDIDVLIRFGAKDNVLLAQGQLWRLFTPMFLHSGFLHFAFNNWALYAIAYQIEYQLGAKRFLILYFGAGIGGNIASAVLRSTSISLGASGALFGLFGLGLYLERVLQAQILRATGTKPKAGAFTVMALGNIAIGFLIPNIDNSAHVGGLVVGLVFGYAWLRMVPNRLLPLQLLQGRIAIALSLLLLASGAALGSSRWYVLYRLEVAIRNTDQIQEKYVYLSRVIQLDQESVQNRLYRLHLALQLSDFDTAAEDFRYLAEAGGYELRLKEMVAELEQKGFRDAAEWLLANCQKLPFDG